MTAGISRGFFDMTEIKGIITSGVGGKYSILTPDGEEYKKCSARGLFRHEKITPLPGDSVVLKKSGGEYFIDEILQRKNSLIRPPLANIDTMFIVCAAASPAPSYLFCDKLCAICEHNGINPVIVITKSELADAVADEFLKTYKNVGYDVFVTSAKQNTGIDELSEFCKTKGGICVFSGESGVGKSTLLNALFPELDCEVGQISVKIERGKNTTRRVQLHKVSENAFFADTPGFSMLDFEHFDFFKKEDLPYLFPEFEEYLFKCKYKKCSHTGEDGCIVSQLVEEGKIQRTRHESYMSIYSDIKDKKDWQ